MVGSPTGRRRGRMRSPIRPNDSGGQFPLAVRELPEVALFKKKSEEPGDNGDEQAKADKAPDQSFQADARKARRFFEHAQAVADTRNYDYAIECYVQGLRHDPEAMDKHEALRDVALKRKVGNGKPAGMFEKPPVRGKTALEKMLASEYLWSKDPLNAMHALGVMENAVACELYEVAHWVGNLVLEANQSAKRPSKHIYIKARDLYTQMEVYDKAVEACRLALSMDPQNMALVRELRNLEAENTLQQGGYDNEGDFRKGVRDVAKQTQLNQEDQLAATDRVKDEIVERARAAYQQNPDDVDTFVKLVRALVRKEEDQAENEAISLLEDGYRKFEQYRFKVQIGDIRMKQYARRFRQLRREYEKNPTPKLRDQMKELAAEQLAFELEEYARRVENYPTDMGLRYQLGRRQLLAEQHDDAIASLQQAKGDPKHRAAAARYLGEAFARKGWNDEAIDTFREGIEAHGSNDDKLALELRYHLMDALEARARKSKDPESAQDAANIASQIAQTNINYKDIRDRLEKIRAFASELKQNA